MLRKKVKVISTAPIKNQIIHFTVIIAHTIKNEFLPNIQNYRFIQILSKRIKLVNCADYIVNKIFIVAQCILLTVLTTFHQGAREMKN